MLAPEPNRPNFRRDILDPIKSAYDTDNWYPLLFDARTEKQLPTWKELKTLKVSAIPFIELRTERDDVK
jgi:hypothetical protein